MRGSMKKQRDKPSPPYTVNKIAEYLNCPFEGNGQAIIKGISSLEKAKNGDLVFISDRKFRKLLEGTQASAAIIPTSEAFSRIPVIKSENPHLSFIKVIELFHHSELPEPGIHPTASVSPMAKIGNHVSIGAFSYIGDNVEIGKGTTVFPLVTIYPGVSIGQDCIIHSHVSIRSSTEIGKNVIIHNGATVGSDGFGYVKKKDGSYEKIPQIGKTVIKDRVEIGVNTAVDRAALDSTVINRGVKIDNLVQIGHNVKIGENAIIAGQTGISGSVKVGKNVVMGGQVGVADHIEIGDNVIIAAKTGVTCSVPPNAVIAGYPHLDIMKWRKIWASLSQLRPLMKEVKRLKKRLEILENKEK